MVKPEIQQQVIVTIKNRHSGLLGYQVVKNGCHGSGFMPVGKQKFTSQQQLPTLIMYHTVSRGGSLT